MNTVDRVIAYLNSLPADEVVSSPVLQSSTGIAADGGAIRRQIYMRLKDYQTLVTERGRPVRYWGQPDAIKALVEAERLRHEN